MYGQIIKQSTEGIDVVATPIGDRKHALFIHEFVCTSSKHHDLHFRRSLRERTVQIQMNFKRVTILSGEHHGVQVSSRNELWVYRQHMAQYLGVWFAGSKTHVENGSLDTNTRRSVSRMRVFMPAAHC